jgi:adenosylmethionine-8-amino-7-oxononanoate aminotransferase
MTGMNSHAGLTQAQLDAHWMAFTGNRQFKADPRLIVEAKGRYYTDAQGRKIFDGLSGLWTCGLGHSVPKINEAVAAQIKTLDYCPAFQFGTPVSFQLASLLSRKLRCCQISSSPLNSSACACGNNDKLSIPWVIGWRG